MLSFTKARQLAAAWVSIICDGEAEIVDIETIAKPYGWVFSYQASAFLNNPSDPGPVLVGNAPILVDRINYELRVLGSGRPIQQILAEYERVLPPACLLLKPELPAI